MECYVGVEEAAFVDFAGEGGAVADFVWVGVGAADVAEVDFC